MKNWKKILHPVRFEIIQALAGGKYLTASQLAEYLPKTPHATLYRHIKYLYQAGMLVIQEENQKRGTVERVYSLAPNTESISPEHFEKLSKEEHLELFTQFISNTILDYGNYLEQGNINLVEDGISFRQANMYLSDQEFLEMIKELKNVYQKYQQLEPDNDRIKRKFTTIIIPEKGNDANDGD
ncbi:helix-turn-helix domain-containing protein [Gracilibacillus oryzae]|uniref:Helix-turn-helix domain-containing protein n=1 Tax=Gracilibacillus oryzae TaxID=1672701 RepID=A0A7C8GRA1_9BACI|nr:helix-turn-helix domain-containing protein [Gracilibacillus oryzae]KAB8127479.1 helix-turn-helix domain-containing protein [Gracilibacillus oryzae]